MFNYFKRRSFACLSLRGSKNVEQREARSGETEKFREPSVLRGSASSECSCYFAGSLCRLQESPQVSTSARDRFRGIRADNWVSAIERTNRQGIEPRKRTSEKLGIHFPLFHRPYPYPFPPPSFRHLFTFFIDMAEHDRDIETRKRIPGSSMKREDRWASSLITLCPYLVLRFFLPRFYFLSFLTVLCNVFDDYVRTSSTSKAC